MNLNDLVRGIKVKIIQNGNNRNIDDLALDSRKVKKNGAFIAINGSLTNGHNFIEEALNNGANTIFLEYIPHNLKIPENINIVKVKNTQETLGYLTANFYNHPDKELKIIAITGTKGKTTVSNMIRKVLQDNEINCGIIGTLGIQYGTTDLKTCNTTPDNITIQKTMREMVNQGITHLILEASSQAFKKDRLNGINFDIGVILNIDRDHIGQHEHKDFNEYLRCKKKIIPKSTKFVVNKGDKIWNLLEDEYKNIAITFSTEGDADYSTSFIKPFKTKTTLGSIFQLSNTNLEFSVSMPGLINVQNALVTLAVVDQLGLNLKDCISSINNFQSDGRSEILKSATKFNRIIFIDFAHNRLSIQSLLENLKVYKPDRIISIFGLHWNETKIRRFDQGYAAGKYSDLTILTEDHQGPEPFESIAKDVQVGLDESKGNYLIIEDRKSAIEKALELMNENDILVIFGMGNERIQKRGNKEIYFNEEEIVLDYLKKIKIQNKK